MNFTSMTLTAGTVISTGIIDLTAGVWVIHGVAPFNPGSGVSVLGAAISATTNVIDDYSQYTQIVASTNPQVLTVLPKYYTTSVTKTLYLIGLSGGGSSTTNTSITINGSSQNMYGTLRAVRIA